MDLAVEPCRSRAPFIRIPAGKSVGNSIALYRLLQFRLREIRLLRPLLNELGIICLDLECLGSWHFHTPIYIPIIVHIQLRYTVIMEGRIIRCGVVAVGTRICAISFYKPHPFNGVIPFPVFIPTSRSGIGIPAPIFPLNLRISRWVSDRYARVLRKVDAIVNIVFWMVQTGNTV